MERSGMGLAAVKKHEVLLMQQNVNNEVLLQLLQQLAETGAPAALFVEEAGLGSENGRVTAIRGTGNESRIELDGNRSFSISSIMAVNGVFRTGFSTC